MLRLTKVNNISLAPAENVLVFAYGNCWDVFMGTKLWLFFEIGSGF